MERAKNPVGAVRTSMAILRKLREFDGAGVTELADELDVTKGTVHNHLSTLAEEGFVVRRDERFELGLRLFEYGEYVRSRRRLYEIGREEVDRLAEETGELANILVEEGGRGVYLHRATGEQGLSLDTGVGARVYLHNTALGKAILAHLPDERVAEILDDHGLPETTERTVTDRGTLREELAEVRERGYAYDMEERAEGIRCVAAPVITNDGTVQGAVSVAGPTSRMKGDRLEDEVPELVQRTANVVGINLTYA